MFKQLLIIRHQQLDIIDDRVRVLTEIVNNIRAVKMYAYEGVFGDRIMEFRRRELAKSRVYTFVRGQQSGSIERIELISPQPRSTQRSFRFVLVSMSC